MARLRIEHIGQHSAGARLVEHRGARVRQRPAQASIRRFVLPVGQVRGGQAHHGVGIARLRLERGRRPASSLVVVAQVGGDGGEARRRGELLWIDFKRVQVGGLRARQFAECHECLAAGDVGKDEVGMLAEQQVRLRQCLGGPFEAKQAERARVPTADVLRRDRRCAFEDRQRILEAPALLHVGGDDIQQQRVFETVRHRLVGHLCGTTEFPPLGQFQHLAEHRLIGF